MHKESLLSNLAFIKCHLAFLPGAIKRLEESGLVLAEAISVLDKVKEKINKLPGDKGKVFKDKMDQVLRKNSNLKILQEVARVQSGEACPKPASWSPAEIGELVYCPITSVYVEHTFSMFKHIFNNCRHFFPEENLQKTVVCNCFYARKQ